MREHTAPPAGMSPYLGTDGNQYATLPSEPEGYRQHYRQHYLDPETIGEAGLTRQAPVPTPTVPGLGDVQVPLVCN